MILLWRRRFEKLAQMMWVRASLFALLGIAAALLAARLAPIVPEELPKQLGSDAVHEILTILASSMLAVTTFSLSIMVASYSAAANNVSPRATRLLREDPTTQNVLAVFLGSFLFSLVGIVALNTGYYGDRGRFVLFVVSVGVIGIIVFTMLRWIDHLTRLGRVGETTARVEKATRDAIEVRLKHPYLGGVKLDEEKQKLAAKGVPIYPSQIGYIAYVDMATVEGAAAELEADILLQSLPGTFIHNSRPLAVVVPKSNGDDEATRRLQRALDGTDKYKELSDAFEVSEERSYSQDPRFGISVLAEVASRALSSSVNDPGTAIDVLGRGVRLLAVWVRSDVDVDPEEPECTNVYVPEIATSEMFDDLFAPIARDGAGVAEVQIRLQKALLALAEMGDEAGKASALRHSKAALERSEKALVLDWEKESVREIAKEIENLAAAE